MTATNPYQSATTTRQAVVGYLRALGNHKAADKVADCGQQYRLLICNGCGSPHYAPHRCKRRYCPECAVKLAATKAAAMARAIRNAAIDKSHRWRLITLTQPPVILASDGIKAIVQGMRRWRRLKGIRRLVVGGYWTIEAVPSRSRPGWWHVHAHLLAVGSYLPKRILDATWAAAMPGAQITDIRIAKTPEIAAGYITKYMSKDFTAAAGALEIAAMLAELPPHVRLLGAWGILFAAYRQQRKADREGDTGHQFVCLYCGTIGLMDARAGPKMWGDIWHKFPALWPLPLTATYDEIPDHDGIGIFGDEDSRGLLAE